MTNVKQEAITPAGEMEPPVKKHRKEAVLLDKGSIKEEKHLDKVVANSPKLGMKKLKEKAVKGKYQKDTGGMKDLSENPDSIEFGKNKEELNMTGKLQKCSISDATVKAKQLWENVQRSNCTAEIQLVLTNEMHGLLQGHLNEVVFESNECRIVQWLLEMGTPDIRISVAQELKHEFVIMLLEKHSAHCIELILKYGSDESRYLVVECLWGHMVKLMCNGIAAPVVDFIYGFWATPQQRNWMLQEFYCDAHKKTKDDSISCLEDVWKASPKLKESTLATTKANLTELFKKKRVASALVYTILVDYLKQCTPEDRSEMLDQIPSLLLDLVKTGDGARVAMLCFWLGTNKQCEMGMEALRGHLKKIAARRFVDLVLLAMFDSVDDTVPLKKILLLEVVANASVIGETEFGRRVLMYLVTLNIPSYLHVAKVKVFQKEEMLSESKKDITVRKAELQPAVLKLFLESIAEQTVQWLSSNSRNFVRFVLSKVATGPELERVFQAIVRYISNPGNTVIEDDKVYYALAHYGIYNLLKSILQREKEVGLKGKDTFSSILMLEVTEETLRSWICFKLGCCLLIELLECENESAIQELQKKLLPLLEHITSQCFIDAYNLAEKLHVNCYTMTNVKQEAITPAGEMEPPVKKHRKEAVLLDKVSIKEEKHLDKVVANSPKLGMEKLKEKAVKGKYQKDTGGMKDSSETEFKRNKRMLKKTRKMQKCSISDVMQLWENIRRPNCTAEIQLVLTNEMHGLLQRHLHEVVFQPNKCCIVQWLLEIGTPDIRTSVAQELKYDFVFMLVREHTALCIELILKYGSDKSRYLVVECLWGHVVKLMCNDVAAPVVDFVYEYLATQQQRNWMQQEFYSDFYKKTKDDSIRCLEDVWKASPKLKDATLATTKANLTELFEKKLVTSTLVYTILVDYLNQCTPEDRSEMLDQIPSMLLDLVKTEDGARVAMLCFLLGTNKEWEMGMEVLKGHVKDITVRKFGDLVLFAMFDSVDDTVPLKKILLMEGLAKKELVVMTHHLLSYLHRTKGEDFQKGEMLSKSKKDITVRKAELLPAVLRLFLESIAEQTGQWLSSDSMSLLTFVVLTVATGPELEEAFRAIVRYISDPNNKISGDDNTEFFAIAYPAVNSLLKRLIRHDRLVRLKRKDTFSSILMLEVTEETLRRWIHFNEGCQILIELLKCENEPAVQELQKKLSQLLEHITSQHFVAAEILAEKLVHLL